MMLSRQNNFGYEMVLGQQEFGPLTVSFTEPNVAGNGLIVVAYFLCQQPGMSPNLTIHDSAGNSYVSIGGVGAHDGENWSCLLQIWYAAACKGGSNGLTVTQTAATQGSGPGYIGGVIPLIVLGASVFEYSSGLGAVDGSNFAGGVARSSAALILSAAAAGDLLFGYATDFGVAAAVTVDSSSPGFVTEQTEATTSVWSVDGPVSLLAVAQVADSAGLQRLTFDFAQTSQGLETALLVALPCTLPVPSPAPPSPSAPVLSAGQSWPTIF
jgi:hypothetical protein